MDQLTGDASILSRGEIARFTKISRRPDYEPTCSQESFIVPLLQKEINQRLKEFAIPSCSDSRALDVGCGRQPFRRMLSDLGYKYCGFDIAQNEESTVHVLGAIDLPLPEELATDRGFDFILCTEVLEHVADWTFAFQNLAKLLRQGGRLLATCPHFYQLHEEPHDFWRPTLHSLHHFGAKVGLRILSSNKLGDGWDVLGTLLASMDTAAQKRTLTNRVINKTLCVAKNFALRSLHGNFLRRRLVLRSPLYLSNAVVFEKL